jgi:hypothetical protein
LRMIKLLYTTKTSNLIYAQLFIEPVLRKAAITQSVLSYASARPGTAVTLLHQRKKSNSLFPEDEAYEADFSKRSVVYKLSATNGVSEEDFLNILTSIAGR